MGIGMQMPSKQNNNPQYNWVSKKPAYGGIQGGALGDAMGWNTVKGIGDDYTPNQMAGNPYQGQTNSTYNKLMEYAQMPVGQGYRAKMNSLSGVLGNLLQAGEQYGQNQNSLYNTNLQHQLGLGQLGNQANQNLWQHQYQQGSLSNQAMQNMFQNQYQQGSLLNQAQQNAIQGDYYTGANQFRQGDLNLNALKFQNDVANQKIMQQLYMQLSKIYENKNKTEKVN